VARDVPFGNPTWKAEAAVALGLESTLCVRGRPRKEEAAEK